MINVTPTVEREPETEAPDLRVAVSNEWDTRIVGKKEQDFFSSLFAQGRPFGKEIHCHTHKSPRTLVKKMTSKAEPEYAAICFYCPVDDTQIQPLPEFLVWLQEHQSRPSP